jgi:Flp pilus assembly pilin Flp
MVLFGCETNIEANMHAFDFRFLGDEQGQDLVEYTLILSFLMFTVIGLAIGFKSSIAGITSTTNVNLSLANSVSH